MCYRACRCSIVRVDVPLSCVYTSLAGPDWPRETTYTQLERVEWRVLKLDTPCALVGHHLERNTFRKTACALLYASSFLRKCTACVLTPLFLAVIDVYHR